MYLKSASHIFILIAILTVLIVTLLLFAFNPTQEGFDMVPLVVDAAGKIPYGYYQVDDKNMAMLPYGYKVDSTNPKKIIPITNIQENKMNPTTKLKDTIPIVPGPGEPIPDGFYFISDGVLAILPPNMKPNVKNIEFEGNPPTLRIYYNNDYVSETQYYNNQYKPSNYPTSLPKDVYYVDKSHTLVSFLRPNQIADASTGYGAIPNPKLNLSAANFNYISSNYRDIADNYDIQFHNDAEEIKRQNDMYDLNFGEMRVKDQNGNILILPKTNSQGSVTYYQPGEFPFGASTYVPNYEDSVYLSSIGYRTRFGNTHTTGNAHVTGCDVACQAYNEFKSKMDNYYDDGL